MKISLSLVMMNLLVIGKMGPQECGLVARNKVIGLVLTWRPGFRAPQVGSDEAKCMSWVNLSAMQVLSV